MLKGKKAIITGGTRGIGRAIAEEFCRQGADVAICYRSNPQLAKEVKNELCVYGTRVEIVQCDVAELAQVELAVKEVLQTLGSVDILVNNAGITKDKLVLRMGIEDFEQVINTNLKGTFSFSKLVVSHMMKQKYGRIVNISSIAGVKGNPGQANYSASKAGINGLTMSMAKELGGKGITVNAIAPGFIETDMTEILNDEYKMRLLDSISVKRFGRPEDVAITAAFLASEKASYITGQIIGVDGGMMI